MTTRSDNEARGDWRNFKGDHYHLVYALWALICDGVESIAFYQGNDLLMQPPLPHAEGHALDAVSLRGQQGDVDVWVQLKSSSDNWTPLALIEDTLANFTDNVIHSEHKSRQWRVLFVSQGEVQKYKVEEFLKDTSKNGDHKKLSTNLDAQVSKVYKGFQDAGLDVGTLQDVRSKAVYVLQKVVEQAQKLHVDVMISQIETKIALKSSDSGAIKRILDQLVGALLKEARKGPSEARPYDAIWVNEIAGVPLIGGGLLDGGETQDTLTAYARSCERSLRSYNWDERYFVERRGLTRVLGLFLEVPEALFVLVGQSGVGQTWAMADLLLRTLDGRPRLYADGSLLFDLSSEPLATLVANCLRGFSEADRAEDFFLRRFTGVALAEEKYRPPVLIIDNLRVPSSDSDAFRARIRRLVVECRIHHIKLVLVCPELAWERLRGLLPEEQIFTPNRELGQPPKPYSFRLEEFTHDEVAEAVTQRLPEQRARIVASRLRDPAFSLLHNPYLLTNGAIFRARTQRC